MPIIVALVVLVAVIYGAFWSFHAISAATGEGVRELVRSIADALDKIPKALPETTEEMPRTLQENAEEPRTARLENL